MRESRLDLQGGLISLLLIVPGFLFSQSPVGFASMNGGTTGGAAGATVTATNKADLVSYAGSSQAYVIQISDTIELDLHDMVLVTGNKTIEGVGSVAMIKAGGLWVNGDNVIIRNLSIGDSYDGDWSGTTNNTDAIRITGQNVWVDQCDLFASANGLIDIHSSADNVGDFVTISHCRFSNQNSVIVIGESDTEIACRGHLKTTIYHCWFDGRNDLGVNRHMPSVKFGEVHLFNNYYLDAAETSIIAGFESSVIVENNFFRSSNDPHVYADLGAGIKDPALSASGNHYEFTTGDKETYGSAFSPAYTHASRTVEEVPEIVINQSGVENPTGNQNPVVVTDTLRFDFPRPAINLVDVVLNDTDPDGDELIFAAILNDPGGNALVQNNRVYYYPVLHFGPDTVLYQIADANGGSAIGMLLINPEKDTTGSGGGGTGGGGGGGGGGGSTDGISDELIAGLSIFPNPASLNSPITVETALSSYKIESVELRDLTGRNVGKFEQQLSANGMKLQWQGESIPPGLYFLGIAIDNQLVLKKIRID